MIPKSLETFLLIFTSLAVAYIGLSIFGAITAVELPRVPLRGSPTSVGLPYENVSFHARNDSITLRGWFIPGGGDMALIIIQGGYQNRNDEFVDTLNISHNLAQKGYNLLLFDLRGRGESEGEGRLLSNVESDIGGAVDYLKNRGYPAEKISIIGYCSGAASALIFASREYVGALILDGSFTSLRNMVVTQAKHRYIPEFLTRFFFTGWEMAAKVIYHYEIINPIDIVSQAKSPILFIHEQNDKFVSKEDTIRLFQASTNLANDFWEIGGASHSEGYKVYPVLYVERIDDFLRTRLSGGIDKTKEIINP